MNDSILAHEDRDFDLLLAACSWERRSTNVLRLACDKRIRCAYIFRYHSIRPKVAAASEAQHYIELSNGLGVLSDCVRTIDGDLWEPLASLRQMVGYLLRDVGRDTGLRILFDVSTFTKAHVLVLLRYLDDLRLSNKITLLYTDISGRQKGRPSVGVKEIIALPFYGSQYESGRETLMFTFLASEPERVTALWEYIAPQVTVPFYSIRRDGHNPLKSKILVDQFLNQAGVESPIAVPGGEPLEIAARLSSVHAKYRDKYNIVLGAVGSKLQSVGAYLFMKLQNADLSVFYPVAGRYEPDYWNPTDVGPALKLEIFNGFRYEPVEPVGELVAG